MEKHGKEDDEDGGAGAGDAGVVCYAPPAWMLMA
jgi:hypothetical protein